MVAAIGDDDVFETGQLVANSQKGDELLFARNKNDACLRMVQDVGHAVWRFLEIDRDGDRPVAIDGEVGGMPLRAIGAEQADAITRFYAKLEKGLRQTSRAAKEFFAGNMLPTCRRAQHLGARTGPSVHRIQHLGGEGAVAHASGAATWRLPSGLTLTHSLKCRNRGCQKAHTPIDRPEAATLSPTSLY